MARKKTVKQFYTVDERIRRVWDIETIKDIMSKRSFYIASDMRREELNKLWVTKRENQETASFGSNWGYYVGMDEISAFYVVKHGEERNAQLKGYCAAHPEVEYCMENLGYGSMICRPMSTPMVILSGDGETAKGLWYSIGQESIASGAGEATCRWYNDKVAADFIKENGQWKIWHIVVSNDLSVLAGENVSDMPTKPAPGTYVPELEFGEPTIKMLTHNGAMNWSDNYPFIPDLYFCFIDEISYGPEGHPEYEG